MSANNLSFNQISAEMNAIHAQAIGAQPPRAINTGAVITQAQAALLGADVQLVPLTATENGIFDPPAGKGFGTVTVAVPNPNTVETITGTLANPWGSLDVIELVNDVEAKNASVYITIAFAGTTQEFPMHFQPADASHAWSAYAYAAIMSLSSVRAYQATWLPSGLLSFYVVNGKSGDAILVDDYTNFGESIPTALTVIHHPLPEDNT